MMNRICVGPRLGAVLRLQKNRKHKGQYIKDSALCTLSSWRKRAKKNEIAELGISTKRIGICSFHPTTFPISFFFLLTVAPHPRIFL